MFLRGIARANSNLLLHYCWLFLSCLRHLGTSLKITIWSSFVICAFYPKSTSLICSVLLCGFMGGGFHLSPLICGTPARVSHVSFLINPHLISMEAVRPSADGPVCTLCVRVLLDPEKQESIRPWFAYPSLPLLYLQKYAATFVNCSIRWGDLWVCACVSARPGECVDVNLHLYILWEQVFSATWPAVVCVSPSYFKAVQTSGSGPITICPAPLNPHSKRPEKLKQTPKTCFSVLLFVRMLVLLSGCNSSLLFSLKKKIKKGKYNQQNVILC